MAFLDDVYISTSPEGLQQAYGGAERELWRHARIRVHGGKTQVWNSGGVRPEFCDVLGRIAQIADPEARVWKGSGVPTTDQGIRVLGTPLGHADYVETQLRERLDDHHIPEVPDLQSAWALLLHCQPMQTTCCGWSGRSWSKGTLKAMTEGCGHVCAGFLEQILRTQGRASLPASLSQLGRLSVHDEEQASSRG